MIEELCSLNNKVALVTGASSGLGEHFANTLTKAGAKVVLAARRMDRLERLVHQIKQQGGEAIAVSMDVTDTHSIDQAIDEAISYFGKIDILVNNAGVANSQLSHEATEEEYHFIMDVNVKGAWYVAKSVAAHMVENKSGSIINIASIFGLIVGLNASLYSMSKAAVVQMTKAMAIDLVRQNVRVNAICPGFIKTEMNEALLDTEHGKRFIQKMPMKRLGTLEELDAPLLMLASEAGSYITGVALPVDGGHIIKSI